MSFTGSKPVFVGCFHPSSVESLYVFDGRNTIYKQVLQLPNGTQVQAQLYD